MRNTLTNALGCAAIALILAASLTSAPRAQASEPLQYVALGDSVTQLAGFTARYSGHIRADLGLSVQTTNLGVGGSTSGELLERLRTNADYRTAVASADVITLQAGLNDFYRARLLYQSGECGGDDNLECMRSMVVDFSANWSALHDELVALADPSHTAIRPIDLYYPSFASDHAVGAFAILNPYLLQMNQHIAATSLERDLPLAGVHDAFHGSAGDGDPMAAGLLLSDQLHTTDAGNRMLATLLRGAGYLPLVPYCPDVNLTNSVNVVDLFLVAHNFGRIVTAATVVYDVNADGYINIIDMSHTVRKNGMICS